MLGAIARTAAQLCEASDALIYVVDGDCHRLVAKYGRIGAPQALGDTHPVRRDAPLGLAVLDRRPVHVPDITVARRRFPGLNALHLRVRGVRTILAMPLLHDGGAVGGIVIRRMRVRPFARKQIVLLKTFADQAAIAIENARLSETLGARNRELTEALEQQTATSDILRVISRSQTDVQPVFEAIVNSAVRLLNAYSGVLPQVIDDCIVLAAFTTTGESSEATLRAYFPMRLDSGSTHAVTIRARVPLNVADAETDRRMTEAAREIARARGYRSQLVVPMLRHDDPIGTISLTRRETGGFRDDEVALLQTFADQAVIAIENVRLFSELQARNRELTEALEQQTATADILRVISGSPTDLQPVFDIIARNAARLCNALYCGVARFDGELLHIMSTYNYSAAALEFSRHRFPSPPSRQTFAGRTILDHDVVHVPNVLADEEARSDAVLPTDFRSVLSVPMLHDDRPVGAITVWRAAVGPFADSQIEVLRTFADQAVIAIENARLFKELQQKNRALTEALKQQTATSEILRVISQSPTDVQPVFDTILANSTRLCEADYGILFLAEGDDFRAVGFRNVGAEFAAVFATHRRFGSKTGLARMAREKRPIQLLNLVDDDAYREGDPSRLATVRIGGVRTWLGVPLLKGDALIGAIVIYRTEQHAFTDAQIALVQTFADQAVIAIENVRLFNETKEALEQQTATSEILRVISRSPTDVQPVFDAIVETAAHLCEADYGFLARYDGTSMAIVAHSGATDEEIETVLRVYPTAPTPDSLGGRTILERAVVHIPDGTSS